MYVYISDMGILTRINSPLQVRHVSLSATRPTRRCVAGRTLRATILTSVCRRLAGQRDHRRITRPTQQPVSSQPRIVYPGRGATIVTCYITYGSYISFAPYSGYTVQNTSRVLHDDWHLIVSVSQWESN